MDAPCGQHFGLTLTMYGKPNEIALIMFVRPNLPDNFLEIVKPKDKGRAKEVNDNIQRQKGREAEVAKDIVEQSDNAKTWCCNFLSSEDVNTTLDETDLAQKSIVNCSNTMGIFSEIHALTDNFGGLCRTFSGYSVSKVEEKGPVDTVSQVLVKPSGSGAFVSRRSAAAMGDSNGVRVAPLVEHDARNGKGKELGDMPRLVLKKLLKPRGVDLRELVLPGGVDFCLRVWSGIRRYVSSLG